MKDSIKKGFGLGIGLFMAKASVIAVCKLIITGLTSNTEFMNYVKENDPILYERTMKFSK